MIFVYAKRTDTDCFIVVEDELGNKNYARLVMTGIGIMHSAPITKPDGTEFRSAGVYYLCDDASIVIPCDSEGRELV